ncbi:hypothetical protein H0H92_008093 [Tricholoma furcatifolium]|nr:hypothetical protein H0H92_008093 [Tricholoma furcatifolium]
MAQVRGLPLLSSPPPPTSADRASVTTVVGLRSSLQPVMDADRAWDVQVTDYQAMMRRVGQEAGNDVFNGTAVTAAGRSMLKQTPLSKLRKYMDAYNLQVGGIVEKDDLIDAIIRARMSTERLTSYNRDQMDVSHKSTRRYSVPDRSTQPRSRFFGGSGQSSNTTPTPRPPASNSRTNFPRPDLAPDPPPHQRYTSPGGPPPPNPSFRYSASPGPPPTQPSTPSPQPQSSRFHGYPRQQRPATSRSSENLNRPTEHTPPPRQRAASAAPPPVLPPPTLDELLNMPEDAIRALSVNALKSILFTNHVNARMILEKSELVAKVKALVADELHEREKQQEREETEREQEREREAEREGTRKTKAANAVWAAANEDGAATSEAAAGERGSTPAPEMRQSTPIPDAPSTSIPPPPPPKTPPKTRGTAADLERTGLCVICQDEEANIAIVDCGYVFGVASSDEKTVAN